MKIYAYTSIWLFVFGLVAGTFGSSAQESRSKAVQNKYPIKKRTILEEYEPMMVLTAEERLYMKKEREAVLAYRREIIDTLQIPLKKKKKLLRELYLSPTSDKWDKLSAQILEEELEEEQ